MNAYKNAIYELEGLSTLLTNGINALDVVYTSIEEGATRTNVGALFSVFMTLNDISDQMRTCIQKTIKEGR